MFGLSSKRTATVVLAILSAALVLPATAFGQATRTWVSGVGDDANPCSRTAPCKTFAGAISKTATGGIIDAMDDGGFGAVTITKAITIDGGGHLAGVLASGGINAINVNAPSTAQVVLRGLDIEGNGTTLGLNGVNFIAGKSLRIENSNIGFFSRSGILMTSSTPGASLVVVNSQIYDNGGNGVTVAPSTSGVLNKAKLIRTNLQENTCGVVATSFGMSNVFGTDCGTAAAAAFSASAAITTFDSSIAFNTSAGVFSRGGGAFQRIGRNEISGNAFGLRAIETGQIISLSGNHVAGNTTDGAPTSTIAPV